MNRIKQGDIIKNVSFIESYREQDGNIEVKRIVFPLIIVLTQDCDLTWDYEARSNENTYHDKYLMSVIVAPLYNYEHFIMGEHLSELNRNMATISRNQTKTDNKNLRQNETPRYHYLEFDSTIPIVNSVIDFKHYFTVNVEHLQEHKADDYVCSVSELFREQITQRFANYLSRIGLPEPVAK
ncbi:hypothetical protein [Macellibacteroides fermentans]|uniref:hypothetical protein n=1 Tax=Macellibacteroides fermentans TaxID=879969 RepID=UPI00406CD43F